MKMPPFLVTGPADRHFIDDHCANCLERLPDDVEALYCSAWCSEVSETVRYLRRVVRDGRIEQPDVQLAVATRNAFLLAGSYRALGRTLPPATRAEVLHRDDGLCQLCGKPGTEIDHIDGSSADPENLQLLCADCHHAKTAENIVPASPEQSALLRALFDTRVVPDEPQLLADDDLRWAGIWSQLKAQRKERTIARLVGAGFSLRMLRTRAGRAQAIAETQRPD